MYKFICLLLVFFDLHADWMQEQIDRDLAPYKNVGISKSDLYEKFKRVFMAAVTFDQNECAICLDTINSFDTRDNSSELKCHHIFHKQCITEWLKKQNTCPTCREQADFNDEKLKPPSPPISHQEALTATRERVLQMRNISRDTPIAQTARKVDSVAGKIFGW